MITARACSTKRPPPAVHSGRDRVPTRTPTLSARFAAVVSGPMVSTNEMIEAVVGRLWPGSEIRIQPIAAGLTNQNFRVDVDRHAHFVRLPGPSTELLAVDRANELHNTRAAAAAGVGPRVIDHDPASGALVLEWIDGRTMSNAAFGEPGTPARIAEALQRLHRA